MRQTRRLLAAIGLVSLLFFLLNVSAFAQETANAGKFPPNVIEVPQGTQIVIDDDAGTVTISDHPVDIAEGDTFVVYLQDLPIGYVAKAVTAEGGDTVILAEKADKSIYAQLKEEGVIKLTSDMYEFIPASPSASGAKDITPSYSITDYLTFEDGKLTVSVKPAGGTKITVELSNMNLSHSFSDGDVSIVLNGSWKVSSELSTNEDSLGEVTLGEMRIYGIGKIALSIDVSYELSMKYTFSGSFSTGFTTVDGGGGHIIKSFGVSQKSVEGKGAISVSLKITAGVDILVAEADVYAEIGVRTQYKSKTTYHSEWDPPRSVHCDDFKIYIFSNVGAEAKYLSASGKKKTIASSDFELLGENANPYLLDVHFEDGVRVSGCSEGMDTSSIEMQLGGMASAFGSTLSTDGRDRVLETSVNLPWDIETDGDYYISHGNLNLNGHTLTINGDLIQSGGTLTIGSGALIVHGNYRMQSLNSGAYGDSDGSLNMTNANGTITIDGDLILQTASASHTLNAGTIYIKGNITQLTPARDISRFNSGTGLNVVMTADNSHTLSFDDAGNNSIGWITFENDVTSNTSVTLGKADLNGHQFVINGTFTSNNSVDLQDLTPENIYDIGELNLTQSKTLQSTIRFEDMNLNGYELTVNGDMISTGNVDLDGGTLTITGTLYHQGGLMNINGGKLLIGGSYYMVGSDSRFGAGIENYTTSAGYLRMTNAGDEVRVGGDFFTKSKYYNGSNYNQFTAGVLYVGGNFRQLGPESGAPYHNSGNSTNFDAQSGHKTVLTNTGAIEIEFLGDASGFGQLETAAEHITWKGYANWCTLLNDLDSVTSDGMQLSSRGTTSLSGHTVTVTGDMGIGGGAVNVNTGSLTVNGGVTMTGSVNLDAGQLNITGTLNQQDGLMNINGGRLNIGGSYYILGADSRFDNGAEVYNTSSGYLRMTNAGDEVHVGGDFFTKSKYYNGTNYNYNQFTAGVLYVGGNFRQLGPESGTPYNNSGNSTNFDAQSGHKTVLTNTGAIEIEFLGDASGFGQLETAAEQITWKGYANWCTLLNDLDSVTSDGMQLSSRGTTSLSGHTVTVTGDMGIGGGAVNVNTGSLTVNGGVTMTGGVNLDAGQLNITGTLNQQDGLMNINGGRLNIGGSYYILGANSRFDNGAEVYNTSSGYLRMTNAGDEVRVGGDFFTKSKYYNGSNYNQFTAGVLYVGGNFRQLGPEYGNPYTNSGNSASFDAQSGHKTVLTNTGAIEIEFLGDSSGFGQLETAAEQITWKGYANWCTLLNDLDSVTSDGMQLSSRGTTSLSGHTVTVTGDMGIGGGAVNVNTGSLTVNGGVTMTGSVNLDAGHLNITGKLNHQDGLMNINGGRLNIGGSYYILGADSRFDNGAEVYNTSSGYLRMTNAGDEVCVNGDFFTKSKYNNSSSYNQFTAGVLYVGGNFRQLGPEYGNPYTNSGNSASFDAQPGHKTVLTNTGAIEIEFLGNASGFGQLETAAEQITWKGYANWCTLLNDLNNVISDGMQLSSRGTTSLSGHTVTVTGDMGIGGGAVNVNTGSLTVNGGVTMTGSVNLDAGHLNITGTLNQQDGLMNINGGRLNIGGSYYILGADSRFDNGAEVYNTSSGYLRMTNAGDEVRVGGDFFTKSKYFNSADYNRLTAGVLYVGGNFRQLGPEYGGTYNNSGNSTNFDAQSGHKTVLTNTGAIEIEFLGNASGFGQLETAAEQITWKGYANWCTLLSDLNSVTSDGMQLSSRGTTSLSGHTVTVTGDMGIGIGGGAVNVSTGSLTVNGGVTMTGSVNLDAGQLNITGTLNQQDGLMNINGGRLNIGGSYYILGADSRFDNGAEVYNTSSGYLRMTNAGDEVRVNGDFFTKSKYNNSSSYNQFTAGVLYVGGNFRQLGPEYGNSYTNSGNSACFDAQPGHKTVLTGTGIIEVTFLGSSSQFGTLEITQPIDMYVFTPNPCWTALIQPEAPALGVPDFTLPAALNEIEESAFEGIAATIVYIPDDCLSIGEYAFRNAAIVQIRIPAGCAIADTAFEGCEALLIFGTPGSAAETFCETHDHCTFIAETE